MRFLLALAIIGMGVVAAANPPAALPQQEGTPAPFVVPTLSPTPTPFCPELLRNRLIVYERARVTDDDPSPLNIRNGPGTTFDVIGQMPSGSVFFVLAGPQCSQRYPWYRIRYGAIEGWVAEGTASQYFVDIYLPG